ncbi:cytochrome o ubiquinol oxidase subunit IV [Candidatus Saccharibacteria bacterium 49-20]|nr:MAG: cytochrome o ubiquinol oxidase subunit IV [Candidatus Saccharibacteria bacterium 49-20]
MRKPELHTRDSAVPYKSYVVGFILSVLTTLLAYFFVVNDLWPKETLVYIVMAIAVVQLIVQVVFFLHIGRGSRWKLMTFIFTILIVAIVVVGSIWIMDNLNYNMMDMTPQEQQQYMSEHEGI